MVVKIEDSKALASKAAFAVTPADFWSVQVTGDVGCQYSTGGGGACQKVKVDGVNFGTGSSGQKSARVADVVPKLPLIT